MKLILDLALLLASLSVLLLCFATGNVPRYYRLSQYAVFVAFFSAFTFSVANQTHVNHALGGVALSIIVAAAASTYFRASGWRLPERLEFLTRSAIWLPVVLFTVVSMLYAMLLAERNNRKPGTAHSTATGSPADQPLRDTWKALNPFLWLILISLSTGSSFAQKMVNRHARPAPQRVYVHDWTLDQVGQVELLKKTWFKYYTADSLYRECYKTGDALIVKADSIREALQCQLTEKDSVISGKDSTISVKNTQISQLDTALAELAEKNRRWVPKTGAGIFFRKVRNGLAYVGGGVVVGGVVRLVYLFR